jgi:kynurenine formamidase
MLKMRLCLVLVGGVVVWGCGPTSLSSRSHPSAKPNVARNCRAPERKVVDLTHRMHGDMAFWPGGVGFKQTRTSDYERGYRLHTYEMGEGTGTHVDAPGHFIEGKRAIDQIPVSELVVPVVVINVREKAAKDPDYLVAGNDIVDWEAIHGPVPVGSVFIANTGWHDKFSDPDKYANVDDQGVMHFPGFSKAAAQLLVERDVVGIGIDTFSIDHGPSTDFAAHKVMLAANKYQIENLANLDELPETGATLIVGVLPVSEGSQAQARVLALVPEPAPGDEEEDE